MSRIPAIAYLRRHPSEGIEQQRKAVADFARNAGFEIVAAISDTSDASAVLSSGFARVLRRIEWNQAQTIIVASANSFAADPLLRQLEGRSCPIMEYR